MPPLSSCRPRRTEVDKLDAIAVIRDRSDQDARALLGSLPAGLPPNVQRAAAAAIVAIDQHLERWRMVQHLWYGLSLGSVLLLAAIGLAITFGVMGVINMAHGEMVMLGAYTTFVVQEIDPHERTGPLRLLAGDRHSGRPSWSPAWSASPSSAA